MLFVPHKDYASVRCHVLHYHPTIDHFWIIFRIVILSLATFDEKNQYAVLLKRN